MKVKDLFRHNKDDSLYTPCPTCIEYLSKDDLLQIIGIVRQELQQLKIENARLLEEIDDMYMNDRNQDE